MAKPIKSRIALSNDPVFNNNILYYNINICIITQVIIEILVVSLAENGVIFRYNHLRRGQIFKMAALRFVDVSKEEIDLMKENAIPRNTKHATKFRMTLFKGKM